jgi:hypothetical protein
MRAKKEKDEPDTELKNEMNRVLLDLSGGNYFPSTKLYQLATALLIENQSEFLIGVIDEEKHFKEEWEVSRMSRQWKGWGEVGEEVAKVWLNEEKGVICARFPYKIKVIEEIRKKIPKGKKSWNPTDKIWEFSVEAVNLVVQIMTENFQKVVDLTQAAPPMPISQNGSDPLLSLLDEDDVQRIYKLLAKKYHPDTGGDSDKMARINQIFTKRKGG